MAADSIVGRPIQVDPAGLLGLLQLKTGGANPSELLGAVRPTVEMLDFWLRQQSRTRIVNSGRTFDIATDTVGFYDWTPNDIVVPETEAWWVEAYSLWAPVIGAGAGIVLNPTYMIPSVGTQRYFPLHSNSSNFATGVGIAMGVRDFWLPPGAHLGVYLGGLAGIVDVNADIRYARLPL